MMVARLPLQRWGCGGPHYVKNGSYQKIAKMIAQIQEASIVGDVARSIPRINVAFEDHHRQY